MQIFIKFDCFNVAYAVSNDLRRLSCASHASGRMNHKNVFIKITVGFNIKLTDRLTYNSDLESDKDLSLSNDPMGSSK